MSAAPKSSNLDATFTTWIFLLSCAGFEPADERVAGACRALREAGDGADREALAQDLLGMLRERVLLDEPSASAVGALTFGLLGAPVATDLGQADDREERLRALRRYQFARKLPWIARIIDRAPDGQVGARWVMVEQVAQTVEIMDPYPWDDVDERFALPITDFMVRWELAGRESVRIA